MSPAPNGDERSLGQLFASATAEISALVHDEIALAKAEIRQDAKRAAFGSGALVGALAVAVLRRAGAELRGRATASTRWA